LNHFTVPSWAMSGTRLSFLGSAATKKLPLLTGQRFHQNKNPPSIAPIVYHRRGLGVPK
jgi:hypothetical protein